MIILCFYVSGMISKYPFICLLQFVITVIQWLNTAVIQVVTILITTLVIGSRSGKRIYIYI